MTSSELIDLYSERKKSYQDQIQKVKSNSIALSWIRVIVALLILLLAYGSFKIPALWWGMPPMVVVYALLVSRYQKLSGQKKILENLVIINESEISAQQNDHSGFGDGTEFLNSQHPYAADLDLFGKGSVFQRFNRTCTEPGNERLAEMLAHPLTSVESIVQRQGAVKELSDKLDFRQAFQAIGMSTEEKKNDQRLLLSWLSIDPIVYGKRSYKMLLVMAPMLSITALLAGLIYGKYAPFIIVCLAQWAIVGIHAKRVMLFQDYVGSKRFLLQKFTAHFTLLQGQQFNSPILQKLNAESHYAKVQIDILASRSRALDLRLNIFASLVFNSTVLYDLQCVYRLEKWREQNKEHLSRWLEAVQEADALNSLGNFKFNHPAFVFPEITEKHLLEAEDAGHPLIASGQMISNTVRMDENSNIWIVTGANMAGKSTFLRTVGINAVLGLTGSVVCAKRMVCPLMEVHTGMRNTDSINENQSYFFAELLRLQQIVLHLKSGKRLLVLLDEILRGTNSADKLTGSQGLIRKLVNYPCMAIIATHDLALSEMEKEYPGQVENYHFETFIRGEELSFDYKLKKGVSTGKNATFLMKKMDIIG